MENNTIVYTRGNVLIVDFGNEKEGSEIQGKRPAILIQNDIGNTNSTTLIVAPVTSKITIKRRTQPTHVFLPTNEGNLQKNSVVLLEQVVTIDKTRVQKSIGTLSNVYMACIDKALKVSLGLS